MQQFLRDQIHSYEQVEVLLLLRSTPEQFWTADEIADKLGLPEFVITDAADHLNRRGLLEYRSGALALEYGYRPENARLVNGANGLAQAYDEQRLEIMRLMNELAIERLRSSAARAFADAFLFRRRKDEDG